MSKKLQTSYDRLAENYAKQFRVELDKKPFDRKMLGWLAEKVGDLGIICDMGCGPGQIAHYLYSQGVKVCGVDLSPAMVLQAQRLNPEIHFQRGDMLDLTDVADNSYGGIAAFYAIVNIPRSSVVRSLQELRRVLCPIRHSGLAARTLHLFRYA